MRLKVGWIVVVLLLSVIVVVLLKKVSMYVLRRCAHASQYSDLLYLTYPAKKCHIFTKIQTTKPTSTAARSVPCHHFSSSMQPNGTHINNRCKTSLSTDKWIQLCEWNQNGLKFWQGMMHLCLCSCIPTIDQSPWVNVKHQLQGSLMSWRGKFRKAWGEIVNRCHSPERMGMFQLHHIEPHERMMFRWTS